MVTVDNAGIQETKFVSKTTSTNVRSLVRMISTTARAIDDNVLIKNGLVS